MVALKPPNNSCYCKKNYCQEISEIAQYGHTGYSSKMPNLVTLVIRQKLSNLVTLVIRQKLLPICPQRRRW